MFVKLNEESESRRLQFSGARPAKLIRRKVKPLGGVPHTKSIANKYAPNIRAQLRKHGLPICDMDLFPNYSSGTYYNPSPQYPNGRAEGESIYGAKNFLWGHEENPSADDIKAARVFVALHELTHHIEHTTGIKKSLGEREETKLLGVYPNGYVMLPYFHARHIGEQFADASTVLYMLSNYEGNIDTLLEKLIFHGSGINLRL